ncbi:MAG: hypothetical protein ACYTCU_10055, partial [Planctomycetota bacterium]
MLRRLARSCAWLFVLGVVASCSGDAATDQAEPGDAQAAIDAVPAASAPPAAPAAVSFESLPR